MSLTTREKLLIGLLVMSMAGVGLFYGVRTLGKGQRAFRDAIAVRTAYLIEARVLQADLAQAGRSRTVKTRTRSLIGYVETLAARIQLKDRIQLNLIARDSRSGLQGLNVKVDRLNLDEMLGLVHALENAELPLIVQQMELGPSFRNKELLRLSMRVLARE